MKGRSPILHLMQVLLSDKFSLNKRALLHSFGRRSLLRALAVVAVVIFVSLVLLALTHASDWYGIG
jgi:hypothetical protein